MQEYTLEEIAQHQNDESRWLIIDGKVYDVTKFTDEHPGGSKPIIKYSGKDATNRFHAILKHKTNEDVPHYLDELVIGYVKNFTYNN